MRRLLQWVIRKVVVWAFRSQGNQKGSGVIVWSIECPRRGRSPEALYTNEETGRMQMLSKDTEEEQRNGET